MQPSASHALTYRQAATECSTLLASSASATPAATAAYGLQGVAEGTNPTVKYASRARSRNQHLTRLQYCCRPWSEWTPRENMDDERRRQLAARPPPTRPPQHPYTQLGLRCKHTQQLASELPLPLWQRPSVRPVPS